MLFTISKESKEVSKNRRLRSLLVLAPNSKQLTVTQLTSDDIAELPTAWNAYQDCPLELLTWYANQDCPFELPELPTRTAYLNLLLEQLTKLPNGTSYQNYSPNYPLEILTRTTHRLSKSSVAELFTGITHQDYQTHNRHMSQRSSKKFQGTRLASKGTTKAFWLKNELSSLRFYCEVHHEIHEIHYEVHYDRRQYDVMAF